jgi:hypothetical protein
MYDVADRGLWPDSWPKPLDRLRPQARTLDHGQHTVYEIPFAQRAEFESAWPHILTVKSEHAPLVLLSSPDNSRGDSIAAGVRLRCPPTGQRVTVQGANHPPGSESAIAEWWAFDRIELIVDGDIEKGPQIDGTLKSPVWQAGPPVALGECTSDKPGPPATTARVLFDATRLYVSFDCAEPDTAGLKQDVAERDGKVWEDDCVEVFVTGDLREGYCHFIINPRGVFADAVTRGSKRDDASWTSSAVVKASIVPKERWVVTLSVPLKELAAYVGENQTWVMNLNRTRPARGGMPEAEWSWAILGSSDYHQVLDYGRIEGVRIPRREDGVTRQAPPAPPPPLYEQGREVGGDRRRLLAPDGVHLVDGGWEATAKAWQAVMAQVEFALLDRP